MYIFPHLNIHNYLALIFMANSTHIHSSYISCVWSALTPGDSHTYSNRGTIANMHKSHLSTQTKNPVRNYRIPFFSPHFFVLFLLGSSVFSMVLQLFCYLVCHSSSFFSHSFRLNGIGL